MNGDSAPLCPSLTGFERVRSASHMLPAANQYRHDKGQGQKQPKTRYPEVAHGLPPHVGSPTLSP